MKLQILIPQYKETEAVVLPLLNSILMQQRVDWNDIGVIIVNDGTDTILNQEFLQQFPFPIEYYRQEHAGVSVCRNSCLEQATADYIMFCDADDMFYSLIGLWIILKEIDENHFDALTSVFTEEKKIIADDGTESYMYFNRENDGTFVHGKVYRRQFLIDNNIRYNPMLTIHEDSYFNCVAIQCSTNTRYVSTPFYMWKYRDDSVCRRDQKYYILKTYPQFIDSVDGIIENLNMRNKPENANSQLINLVYGTYYMMNKDEWVDPANAEYRKMTGMSMKMFMNKYKDLWNSIKDDDKLTVSGQVRSKTIGEGMKMEYQTFNQWMEEIKSYDIETKESEKETATSE